MLRDDKKLTFMTNDANTDAWASTIASFLSEKSK